MDTKQAAVNYTLDQLRKEQPNRSHISRTICDLITEFDIKNKLVVELGSGIGQNLASFLSDNEVLGVEGLESAVQASLAAKIPAIQANLENSIPVTTSSTDWVLLLDVLEHLVDPESCLREANRILHNNGYLVVNVPNQYTFSNRLKILFGNGIHATNFFRGKQDWNNPHIRFFRHTSISALLRKCGFEVKKDLSARFPAVPMSHELNHLGLSRVSRWLAGMWPELFCAGFFLVARKTTATANDGF
jgi:SAM-dependent methyltransferase